MKIGLDLSVIQTPHRMRGIGATAINFINHLSDRMKADNSFIIYLYERDQQKALSTLKLADLGIKYEIRTLRNETRVNLKLPGRLKIINGVVNNVHKMVTIYTGDKRAQDLSGVEVFLQFDQSQAPPKKRGLKTALVLYDIIPYVMESDYLWSYRTARRSQDSRKSAFRKSMHRRLYAMKTKAIVRRADILFAISEHTKKDFVKFFKIKPSDIEVVHLGIAPTHPKGLTSHPPRKHYVENSWGYFQQTIKLNDKPFLLYVGGADPRRKLEHLVAAYNNLKAQGHDIRLALAGDIMKGPKAIPTQDIQKSLSSSSYLNDLVFLGFVTDEEREWLYENALAFVYPSLYEGFGLPILEAMRYGTPVITYDNSSITEIADKAVIYARDSVTIEQAIRDLLEKPELRKKYGELGRKQAGHFNWQNTVTKIVDTLTC